MIVFEFNQAQNLGVILDSSLQLTAICLGLFSKNIQNPPTSHHPPPLPYSQPTVSLQDDPNQPPNRPHSFQLSSSWSILNTSARVFITEVSSCHSPAQTFQEFSISQKVTTSIPRGSLPSTAISLLTPAPLHPLSTNHIGLCVQPVASVNILEVQMVLLAQILFSQMS